MFTKMLQAIGLLLPAATKGHPMENFPSVNYAEEGLPKVQIGGRVLELFNGEHFDALLRDTPDELRPPSLIAFYGHKTCPGAYKKLNFQHFAERSLPSRERLMIAKYDIDAAPKRAWFEFTPERDLQKRFNVTECPTVAFVPRMCDGWTQWCEREVKGDLKIMGCEDFVEQCSGVEHWNGEGSLVDWVAELVAREGTPKLSRTLDSYAEQEGWLRSRDECTTSEFSRGHFYPPVTPGFSEEGYKAVETPKELQKWLLDFYNEKKNSKAIESWGAGLTQNSFHTTKMYFYDLDEQYAKKTAMADKYIKPLLEEWSGVKDLEVTSIYGIREYQANHWLANHIDRETTHAISATISVAKLPTENATEPDTKAWPLEFINWKGQTVRYAHPPGTVVFYESVKGIHGRPFKNPVEAGNHLGVFLHYRPPKSWGDWQQIAEDCLTRLQSMIENVAYHSTPPLATESPELSNIAYDEDVSKPAPPTSFGITFSNTGNQQMAVFWQGSDINVLQCVLNPGQDCGITTFPGHTFYWTQEYRSEETTFTFANRPRPIPGSLMEMTKDKVFYPFGGKEDL